jgi:TonB family protein
MRQRKTFRKTLIINFILLAISVSTYSQDKFEKLESEFDFQPVLNTTGFPGMENSVVPKYINGKTGFDNYIDTTVVFPKDAQENNITGTVVLMYAVNSQGNVCEIQVSSSTPEILNQELERVLMKSGPWIPARKNGKYIKMRMTISYEFKNNKP